MNKNKYVITKEMMDVFYNKKLRYGIRRKYWYKIADVFMFARMKYIADKIIIFSDNTI